jgi:uncharacterized protein YdeI (BOF family)
MTYGEYKALKDHTVRVIYSGPLAKHTDPERITIGGQYELFVHHKIYVFRDNTGTLTLVAKHYPALTVAEDVA